MNLNISKNIRPILMLALLLYASYFASNPDSALDVTRGLPQKVKEAIEGFMRWIDKF